MPLFELTMPQVENRGEWERLRKANGRPKQSIGPPVAFCKSCTIGIGRSDYVQREIYLLPVARVRRRRPTLLTWQHICSYCALQAYDLSFGFCLVSERDWENIFTFNLMALETQKIAHLTEHLRAHWPKEGDPTPILRALTPPVLTASSLLENAA